MVENWLTDIVVVNESTDAASAGDVMVFRSHGEACAYLEPWWVEERRGFAFSGTGALLTLGVDRGSVQITGRNPTLDGPEVVRSLLKARAFAVLDARRAKARKRKTVLATFEEEGQLPESAEGLIAYGGFDS